MNSIKSEFDDIVGLGDQGGLQRLGVSVAGHIEWPRRSKLSAGGASLNGLMRSIAMCLVQSSTPMNSIKSELDYKYIVVWAARVGPSGSESM